MKKIKNKQGFTLVELLVAITILGIIMVIALPQLSNIQQNNKTTKYRKYAETMLTSAKLYTDSYTEDMFGNNKSGCVDVPYDDMKDKDLIKDIKVDGSTCKSNNSYIRVRKANDHYFYEVSISCKDKEGKVVYEELLPADACNGSGPDEVGPTITITPNTKNWTKGTNEKVKVKVWDAYGMLENTKVKLTWLKEDGTVHGSEKTHDFKNKRYDASNETNALEVEIEVPQNQTGIFRLKVTPIDVRDSLGNYQSNPVTSGDYKLDNTPPGVPSQIYMYKWNNNSTTPSSSSGLTAYTNNTWTNKYVYTYPATSTDGHAGGVYYQYKTTGSQGSTSGAKATSKSINKQGTSTIAWRACDQLGNCSSYTTANTVKIDITKPSIDSVNNSSGGNWTNAQVNIEATASDTGGSGMSAIYYYYDNDSTYRDDWSITKTATKVKGKWSAERNNIVYLVAVDVAGNVSTAAATNVKIDTTAPSTPTASMYKWTNNSTRPTSSSGLSGYANDTWSNKNVYTVPTGGSDAASGLKEYKYTTTGTTTNASDTTATSRNIEAEGISTIAWKACDNAGNCSAYSPTYTIKIDKTIPGCTVSGGSGTWINATSNPGSRTITAVCSDTGSGCRADTTSLSYVYSTNINTTTAGAAGNGAGGTVYDNAGNSYDCAANQTVRIDKAAPTLSSISNSKNNVWTSGTVVITATANDTGGSGVSHTKYYYDATGTRHNDWDSDSTTTSIKGTWSAQRNQRVYLEVTDVAGNVTSGYDAGVVKIDKTAPTVSSISNPSGGNASLGNFSLTLTGSDGESGIQYWQYSYDNSSWVTYPSSNYSPFVTTAFTAQRNQNVYIRVCDNVGYCSSSSTSWIHIVDACASGYTTIGSYGDWGSCSVTCGTGKYYRDVNLVSTFDSSISCGKRSTQDEGTCTMPSCECAHEYGGGYNSTSGTYKNYWTTTASGSYSYSNCSHSKGSDGKSNGHHDISSGQTLHKGQCIKCGFKGSFTWCPCAYGSGEC